MAAKKTYQLKGDNRLLLWDTSIKTEFCAGTGYLGHEVRIADIASPFWDSLVNMLNQMYDLGYTHAQEEVKAKYEEFLQSMEASYVRDV